LSPEDIVFLMRNGSFSLNCPSSSLKELDRETAEKEALQEGGGQGVPVSGEETGAIQSAGSPGNCCPSVIPCHKSKTTACLQALPLVPATAQRVSSQTLSTDQGFWKKPGTAL